MSELPEISRTFHLDDELIASLTSADDELMLEAIEEIPEALTRREVQDIGAQINLSTGPGHQAIEQGRKLETETLFNLGNWLLHHKTDLVSTANIASELRGRGLDGMIGFIVLKYAARKKKQAIIKYITSPEVTEEFEP